MRRMAAVLALGLAQPLAAQVHSSVSARTRYLDPSQGWTSSSLWLGLDLGLDRPRWGFRLGATGSPVRSSWGGEASGELHLVRSLGGGTELRSSVESGLERTIRGGLLGEAWLRAGAQRTTGPLVVSGGVAALASMAVNGAGAYASAQLNLGSLQVNGELGQLTNFGGSFDTRFTGGLLGATTAGAEAAPDTATNRVGSIRRLGHFVLGGRLDRGWFELSGRIIRRSRFDYGEGGGWEVGVGVQPIRGVLLQLEAGRAPIGPTIYLPFRNQLSFGIALANRRPRREKADEAATVPARASFELEVEGPRQTVRIHHPSARRVELIGDFSDWQPVPLEAAGKNDWQLTLRLRPGVYLVNLRLDGGSLEVPPGLTETSDEFGGRSGVLIIPDPDLPRPS